MYNKFIHKKIAMLETIFGHIKDNRRKQGRRYKLKEILFFSVLGILSGAKSYRTLHAFIKEHKKYWKKKFKIEWKNAPAYTTIRSIIQGVCPSELEKAFRKYAEWLAEIKSEEYNFVNLDGKTLRGSFDHFEDQKAIQVFSAFLNTKNIILAHEEIEEQKTNEIPIAQDLIKNLGLKNCIFTLDALHCQKKHSKRSKKRKTKE